GLGGRDRRAGPPPQQGPAKTPKGHPAGRAQPGAAKPAPGPGFFLRVRRGPCLGPACFLDGPDGPVLLLHPRPAPPDRLGALTRIPSERRRASGDPEEAPDVLIRLWVERMEPARNRLRR